ncbi:hypothetical protein [Streptomyces sp. NRRL S-87]|uniref:hypothetical protein n=1 Tax=Streptomyces sp. NRRL S-87 TaxID=1463920 RepID=UPI0004BFA819|nr:hypothetical protein [Streptomyces sp. NRRL S-87]
MDDVPQGGAGGAPLDDDTPQDRRRRPHAGPDPGRGGGPTRREAAERREGTERETRETRETGTEAGGDARTPGPESQERSARQSHRS